MTYALPCASVVRKISGSCAWRKAQQKRRRLKGSEQRVLFHRRLDDISVPFATGGRFMGSLRLFLAICVVITHNGFSNPFIGGTFAVMIFFIISGFFITLVLNEKYTDINPTAFYLARYLRLIPTYLFVSAIVALLIRPELLPNFNGALEWAYYSFSKMTLFGIETFWWFKPDNTGSLIWVTSITDTRRLSNFTNLPQMWSVGIEILFYAISPFFVRKFFVSILILIAAFLIHCHIVFNYDPLSPIFMRNSANYFWLYMAGVVGFHVWKLYSHILDKISFPALSVSIFAVLLAAGLTYIRHIPIIPFMVGIFTPFRNDLSLIIFALFMPVIFHYTRRIKWDRAIGELSYPLYVVHWPITGFLITGHRGDLLWSLIIVSISVVAAALLHISIERPMEQFRTGLARRELSSASS
ncbi:acyltransferase [Ochrobactrum sp. A-1]|nr:acyltransferase [Ochrobactrum sp. A-1]